MKDFIQYDFRCIFKSDVWQHAYQVDKDFTDFLSSKGLKVDIVKVLDGATAQRLLLISKKELLPGTVEVNQPVGPQKALEAATAKLQPKTQENFKGKYNWKKGVLKK